MLSFLATFAQEESVKKSESMNWSLRQRFRDGKLLTPALLGIALQKKLFFPVGKVDLQCGSEIVPIEVKSEQNVKARSLAGYHKKYTPSMRSKPL